MCFCAETHVWSSNSFLCPPIFHFSEWADRARCDGLCLAPPPSPASHQPSLASMLTASAQRPVTHSRSYFIYSIIYLFILNNFNLDFLSKMKYYKSKKVFKP